MSNREGEKKSDAFSIILGAAAGIGAIYAAYKGVEMITNSVNTEPPQEYVINENELIIADTEQTCKEAAAIIKRHCESSEYLGFDCLWTNNPGNRGIRQEVGMLQLATNRGFCVLIRLCNLQNKIPPELKDILRDPHIIKVGVGSHRDTIFIQHDFDILIRGTLDLSALAEQTPGIPQRGLASLAERLCNIDITETNELRAAVWETSRLTPNQIEYAKKCALAGIKIFENLRDRIVNSRGFHRYKALETQLKRDLMNE
jgi:ribonuclease D